MYKKSIWEHNFRHNAAHTHTHNVCVLLQQCLQVKPELNKQRNARRGIDLGSLRLHQIIWKCARGKSGAERRRRSEEWERVEMEKPLKDGELRKPHLIFIQCAGPWFPRSPFMRGAMKSVTSWIKHVLKTGLNQLHPDRRWISPFPMQNRKERKSWALLASYVFVIPVSFMETLPQTFCV